MGNWIPDMSLLMSAMVLIICAVIAFGEIRKLWKRANRK